MLRAPVVFFEEEEVEEVVPVIPRRVFRDRLDPLNISDANLIRYYRFPRHVIIEMCGELDEDLSAKINHAHPIPVATKILISLRFLASGSFQNVVGDIGGISQSSSSRVLKQFCGAMVRRAPRYIQFPMNNARKIASIKADFYNIAQFPNVIGAIDGTHVQIKAPVQDEQNYVNRHGVHSINVQGVCDAKLAFLNVVVRWPGSTHDSFIWRQSLVRRHLDTGVIPVGWLLGDSGYPLECQLMTPIRNPVGPELVYNEKHCRTRSTIERCFGLLKSRFRCLHSTGGTLCYTPQRTQDIIVTACLLHNWCIHRNLPFHDEVVDMPQQQIEMNGFEDAAALQIRNTLVQRFL